MAEVGILVVLVAVGWVIGRADSATSPAAALAGALPIGAAAYVTVMTVLVATQLPLARPTVGLALTVILAAALAAMRWRSVANSPRHLLLGAGGTVALVAAVATVATAGGFVSTTVDSFRYVVAGGLLDRFGDLSVGSLGTLWEKRGLATGALHGLAVGNRSLLAGLTPLVAVSVLAILWVAIQRAGRSHDRRLVLVLTIGAVLLLATIERFQFHALYINSHMLVAAWLLLLQLLVLRLLRDYELPPGGVLVLMLLGTAVITARPEGPLLVGLIVAPALVDREIALGSRRWAALAIALPTIAWPGLGLGMKAVAQGSPVPASVLGLMALGVGTLVAGAAMQLLDRIPRPRAALLWLHGLLWGALTVAAALDPGVLYWSALSTMRNVAFAGGWGSTLLIVAVLLVVAFVLLAWPGHHALAFTLVTFVPLGMMLAYLRDGAFRVGPGDSLNRMLMHLLPIAVLALATSAFGDLHPKTPVRRLMARTS